MKKLLEYAVPKRVFVTNSFGHYALFEVFINIKKKSVSVKIDNQTAMQNPLICI